MIEESSKQMMTKQEVIEILDVSNEKLLRMCRRGEIPHIRINNKNILFSRKSIEKWLKEREVPAKPVNV